MARVDAFATAAVNSVASWICASEAQCHSELEQFEQALAKALRATEEDATFGRAWDCLGVAHRFLNQEDKAVECFQKAIELGLTAKIEKAVRDDQARTTAPRNARPRTGRTAGTARAAPMSRSEL